MQTHDDATADDGKGGLPREGLDGLGEGGALPGNGLPDSTLPDSALSGNGLPDSGLTEDEAFLGYVADRLAGLPGVTAVALGGSRAAGTHRPDSDWDFAVYYRGGRGRPAPGGGFTPADLRALGWPGTVSELGEWGGGVFNGGAWLDIAGRHIDVHYRDLDDVEHQLAEAREGRFGIERLMFHLAGIPTYLVVAELAVNRVLHGELPRPAYPEALRLRAPHVWWGSAKATLDYARAAHAPLGHVTDCAGALATAACQAAHAVLAGRGQWVTNEKRLLDLADVRGTDGLLTTVTPDPASLAHALDEATASLGRAVEEAIASNGR